MLPPLQRRVPNLYHHDGDGLEYNLKTCIRVSQTPEMGDGLQHLGAWV
jgi:hypothetical protein